MDLKEFSLLIIMLCTKCCAVERYRVLYCLTLLCVFFCTYSTALAVYCDQANEIPFSSEVLERITRSCKVSSIEELLPLLSSNLRQSYTLLHHSRSTQGATPTEPRAILYGEDAKFILAFNGSKGQEGGDKLEVLEFKSQENAFELREVTFSPDSKPVFSGPNPKRCLSCHQEKPKPIWDQYDFWIGAYAGIDDNLADNYSDIPFFDPKPFDLEGFQERKEFSKFLLLAKNHPRYKHLVDLEHFESNPESKTVVRFPNMALSTFLTRLNSKKVANLLIQSAKYSRFKYLLALSLTGCRISSNKQWEVGMLLKSLESSQMPKLLPHEYEVYRPALQNVSEYDFSEVLPALMNEFGVDEKRDLELQFEWFPFLQNRTTNRFQDRQRSGLYYNDGLTPRGQSLFVATLVLENLAKEEKFLKDLPLHSVAGLALDSPRFGDRYLSTLDNLGKAVMLSEEMDPFYLSRGDQPQQLCTLLFEKAWVSSKCEAVDPPSVTSDEAQPSVRLGVEKTALSKLSQYCADCHGRPGGRIPLPFDDFRALQAYRGRFTGKTILQRLKDGTMPPPSNLQEDRYKTFEADKAQIIRALEN